MEKIYGPENPCDNPGCRICHSALQEAELLKAELNRRIQDAKDEALKSMFGEVAW